MREVICQFCQRKCRLEDKSHWRCDYHGGVVVKYYYPENLTDEWYTLTMVYRTDEAMYHAAFLYNNPLRDWKFKINKVKKGYRGLLSETEIFRLDFHPDITPENLPNKITKYIIFS